MRRLEHVAQEVIKGSTKLQRKNILKNQLETLLFPIEFQLPLNPHIHVSNLIIDKCQVMESKKKPLWLTFQNNSIDTNTNEKSETVLILKVGDDLRQDVLILQVLRIMHRIWLLEGLDLHMMLYDCISTGNEQGLLQIVPNAKTLGSIVMETSDEMATKAGNVSKSGSLSRKIDSAYRAFADYEVLKNWLYNQVLIQLPKDSSEKTINEEFSK